MKSFALAVVGDRRFTDYALRCSVLDRVHTPISIIVSGGARGADTLAERYADSHNIPMQIFHAKWNQYGRSAGPRRNTLIVESSDAMVAFLAPGSIGTRNSIAQAKERGIPVHIVHIGGV